MLEGVFHLCVDERILAEYESVLRRPRLNIPPASIDEVIAAVRLIAEPVAAVPLRADLPDENDLPFIEVAATVDAVLVTGNPRHFPKRACKGVVMVSPAEFLELVRRST